MTYFTHYPSPLGVLTVASDGKHITGLWIEGQKHFGSTLGSDSVKNEQLPVFHSTIQWLDAYFAGENPSLCHIPLLPSGTPFQIQVWAVLREIPYGETVTYGQIAAALGKDKMSAQAVGNAVGRNPISILIPCHRVVGANGQMTGYAAGVERKQYLLTLEKAEV